MNDAIPIAMNTLKIPEEVGYFMNNTFKCAHKNQSSFIKTAQYVAYIGGLLLSLWTTSSFAEMTWQYKCDDGYYVTLTNDKKAKLGKDVTYDGKKGYWWATYVNLQRFSGLALGRVDTNPERRREAEVYIYEGVDDTVSMSKLLIFNSRTKLLLILNVSSLSQSQPLKCQSITQENDTAQ